MNVKVSAAVPSAAVSGALPSDVIHPRSVRVLLTAERLAYGRSGSVPPVDLMEYPDEPDENTRPLKRPSSVPLLCGWRLLFEGRVVGVLEFSEWDAAVARVKPTIAVPVDPASGGVFDIRDGLVRSVVEAGGTGSFDLVEPVDHLYERELKLSFH